MCVCVPEQVLKSICLNKFEDQATVTAASIIDVLIVFVYLKFMRATFCIFVCVSASTRTRNVLTFAECSYIIGISAVCVLFVFIYIFFGFSTQPVSLYLYIYIEMLLKCL